jgi:nitrite reductase/ring-hydroxylating ferredoxin subunit
MPGAGGGGNGAGEETDPAAWTAADALPELSDGELAASPVAGEPVLFAKVGGTLFAYRLACPECGESLAEGRLEGEELACPKCAARYDVRRAGRGVEDAEQHLEPVPLLVDDGGEVRIALGSAS